MRCATALLTGLLLVPGLAGCEYREAGDPPASAPARQISSSPTASPTTNRAMLDVEAKNFTELQQRLGVASGTLLLEDSVAVGAPGVWFQKNAMVKTAGTYTVTAACVGGPDVRLSLNQDPRTGATPVQLVLDCSQVTSQLVQLQAGYVSAALVQFNPGSAPWTGAVAGVRITADN